MFLTLIISTFVCYVVWMMARQRKRMKVLDPPALPGQLPILGHGYILYGDSLHAWSVLKWVSLESLVKGGVITMNIGPRLVYAISDPDDCFTVANTCLIKDYIYDFAKAWLGNGLFSGSGPQWKRHRKLLNPSFNQHVLDGYLGNLNNQARRLVGQISPEVGKGPFLHFEYICKNTLESVFQTVFGVTENYDDVVDYLNGIQQIQRIFTERFQKFWLHPDFIFNMSSLKAKQDKVVKLLHKLSDRVIQDRKLQMSTKKLTNGDYNQNANGGKHKPFLDLLLELSSSGELITDQEIREEVDTFIIAGHDTTSFVLMYTLVAIGSYPKVQENIYKELQNVLGNSGRDVTKYDLNKFVYLEAVIKESLRLYPIAPIIARYAETNVKLKNYTIPAGSSIFLLYWGLHHHAVWGSDAAEFKPERWLNPATLPTNPNAFVGFSVGKRNCIGKTFAMMSMKTTLAHLIQHYKIYADISKMTLKVDVMLKPAHGNFISLELRRPTNNIGC